MSVVSVILIPGTIAELYGVRVVVWLIKFLEHLKADQTRTDFSVVNLFFVTVDYR